MPSQWLTVGDYAALQFEKYADTGEELARYRREHGLAADATVSGADWRAWIGGQMSQATGGDLKSWARTIAQGYGSGFDEERGLIEVRSYDGNAFTEWLAPLAKIAAFAVGANAAAGALGLAAEGTAAAGGAVEAAGWETKLAEAWEGLTAESAAQNAALASAAPIGTSSTAAQLVQGLSTASKVVQAYSYLNRATGQRIDVSPLAAVPPGFERIGTVYMSDAQDKQDGPQSNAGAVPVGTAAGGDNTAALAMAVIALFVLFWLAKGKS